VPELRDRHPTPYRTALRAIRYDPPPPGEGEEKSQPTRDSNFKQRERYASAFSRRDAPEACVSFTLVENRGRRESRVPIAPAVVRTKNARVDHRATGSSRLSPHNGLRLIRTLPGDRAFLPPSPCGLMIHPTRLGGRISTRLDASVGASEPHDFTVRARLAKALAGPRTIRPVSSKTVGSAVRPHAGRSLTEDPPCNPLRARRCRVHRIPPRVRDDSRSAPCRVRRPNL
jgi:hypothetical protein